MKSQLMQPMYNQNQSLVQSQQDQVTVHRANPPRTLVPVLSMASTQKLKVYWATTEETSAEDRLLEVQKMTLPELEKEVIQFGKAKIGQSFKQVFEDNKWTDWFVGAYENSTKIEHDIREQETGCRDGSQMQGVSKELQHQDSQQTKRDQEQDQERELVGDTPKGANGRSGLRDQRVHSHQCQSTHGHAGRTSHHSSGGESQPAGTNDSDRDGPPGADPACGEPEPKPVRAEMNAAAESHDQVMQVETEVLFGLCFKCPRETPLLPSRTMSKDTQNRFVLNWHMQNSCSASAICQLLALTCAKSCAAIRVS